MSIVAEIGAPRLLRQGLECLTVPGHNERAAYPAGQTLGQTASFRQTAPETWCQSRVCGPKDGCRDSVPAPREVRLHPCDIGSSSAGGPPRDCAWITTWSGSTIRAC